MATHRDRTWLRLFLVFPHSSEYDGWRQIIADVAFHCVLGILAAKKSSRTHPLCAGNQFFLDGTLCAHHQQYAGVR